MPSGMRARQTVHPLLLEPTYWRNRLKGLDLSRSFPLIIPRSDLSGPGVEVAEFRLKSHDGITLTGVFARPAWHSGPWAAQIRVVCPGEEPQIDMSAVREGTAEFVFRELPTRRLEDRVLDVVKVCHLATRTEGVDQLKVEFCCASQDRTPDEIIIAEHLFANRLV